MSTGYAADSTVQVVFEELEHIVTDSGWRYYAATVNGIPLQWRIGENAPVRDLLDEALHEYKRQLVILHSREVAASADKDEV